MADSMAQRGALEANRADFSLRAKGMSLGPSPVV